MVVLYWRALKEGREKGQAVDAKKGSTEIKCHQSNIWGKVWKIPEDGMEGMEDGKDVTPNRHTCVPDDRA